MSKREKVRRLAAVKAEDATANAAQLRLLSVAVVVVGLVDLLSVALQTCPSRADFAPAQLHVHRRIRCIPSEWRESELGPRGSRTRDKNLGSCSSSRRELCENPHVVCGASPVFCMLCHHPQESARDKDHQEDVCAESQERSSRTRIHKNLWHGSFTPREQPFT